eukprot:756709-Hanusia_phi.AAC.4
MAMTLIKPPSRSRTIHSFNSPNLSLLLLLLLLPSCPNPFPLPAPQRPGRSLTCALLPCGGSVVFEMGPLILKSG